MCAANQLAHFQKNFMFCLPLPYYFHSLCIYAIFVFLARRGANRIKLKSTINFPIHFPYINVSTSMIYCSRSNSHTFVFFFIGDRLSFIRRTQPQICHAIESSSGSCAATNAPNHKQRKREKDEAKAEMMSNDYNE